MRSLHYELVWAKDRINEHISTLDDICNKLRNNQLVEAAMDIVELRYILVLNVDHLRDVVDSNAPTTPTVV